MVSRQFQLPGFGIGLSGKLEVIYGAEILGYWWVNSITWTAVMFDVTLSRDEKLLAKKQSEVL